MFFWGFVSGACFKMDSYQFGLPLRSDCRNPKLRAMSMQRLTSNSAVGAAHECFARQSNCVAPPGLQIVFAFYPGLTPWATFLTRLPALSHSGTGNINRPEFVFRKYDFVRWLSADC